MHNNHIDINHAIVITTIISATTINIIVIIIISNNNRCNNNNDNNVSDALLPKVRARPEGQQAYNNHNGVNNINYANDIIRGGSRFTPMWSPGNAY